MAALELALSITDLEVGGAEQCLVELAARLDRARFHPVVYCLGARPEVDEASCVPALEAAGIEVHCLEGGGLSSAPRVLGQLTRLFRQHRPDVVQTFLFHANMLGRVAARRAGIGRVVCGIRVAERHSRWHLWADRLTSGLVDRYVCVSQSVAQFSVARGLPQRKIVVIPNGIDAGKYPAPRPADLEARGIRGGRRVLTFVGRLERQKGMAWLIESAALWLPKLPDCDLLIIGKGPERASLEQLSRRLGLGGRVFFAGWRPDVAEVLAASRLLVLPSRWEGMPNVVLQAMASGLPVLATNVEGVGELLGPGATLQTVAYGDSRAMAERLVRLMSEAELGARLGAENRRRSEQNFSIAAMVGRYQALWEDLAARPEGGRENPT